VTTNRTALSGGRTEGKSSHAATVLVVDDDPGLLGVVSAMLRAGGYSVMAAENGEEALAAAAAHKGTIDLLLTDVVMPGIQGPELAEQLGALRPQMRVVLMSGATGVEVVDLVKPFGVGTLLRALQATLEGSHDD
jgi:DNA-binding NtrC family response regulator